MTCDIEKTRSGRIKFPKILLYWLIALNQIKALTVVILISHGLCSVVSCNKPETSNISAEVDINSSSGDSARIFWRRDRLPSFSKNWKPANYILRVGSTDEFVLVVEE